MTTMLHSSARSVKENGEGLTQIFEINREKNGYGFTISGQAPCFVSWVVAGGPAEQIGLDVGDCIISVNGQNVAQSTHEEVVQLIGISFGTLLLGVTKNLDTLLQQPLSNNMRNNSRNLYKNENKIIEDHNKNSEKPRRISDSSLNFSRTDKVLKDLYSGEIFKNITTPSPHKNERKLSNSEMRSKNKNDRRYSNSSDQSARQRTTSHGKEVPAMVVVQSIVAYLGTVEMSVRDMSQVENVSLEAVRGCIYSLRKEQHIHQRVLMKVTHSSVKLYNADRDTIAIYKSENLCFSSVCPEDERFFCLVTAQDLDGQNLLRKGRLNKTFCHVFMIDPEISYHSAHEEKAKRFGIQCSTDTEIGDCIEFPRSPRSLLSIICLLYVTIQEQTARKTSQKYSSSTFNGSNSVISNSTTDSGIVGDHSRDESLLSHVKVVDNRHSLLTRGESSLPPSVRRSAWSTVNHREQIHIVERKSSTSSTDESSRLSPRAYYTNNNTMDNRIRKNSLKFDYSSSSTSTNSVDRRTFKNQGLPSTLGLQPPVSTNPTVQQNVALLSQSNLIRHDNHMKTNNNASQVPPPMNKLSMGKYRIPDSRVPSGKPNANQLRKQNRGKLLMNNKGHLHKRQHRLFNGHFTTRGKAISRSTENVAVSDEDGLSGASSIESLASNASLPSCLNGSLANNFDYRGYQRSSLRAANSQELTGFAAGRISHWAVSFERLLDDPLGVKYFREFLCKEYSEENILFWEACENLRRNSVNDCDKLKIEIKDIYDRFLSPNALMPVNIDSHGQQLAAEALTTTPRPDIFFNQQHQVYTLMKLDSYSRFLKSSLYRQCMVCEMEGRPLPLDPNFETMTSDTSSQDGRSYGSFKDQSKSSEGSSFRRKDKKSQKGSTKRGIFGIKSRSSKSNGSFNRQSSRDSSGSESLFSNPSPISRSSSLTNSAPEYPDPTRVCHVTLWDGTTTVIYAKRSGVTTVGEALGNLCERRGVKMTSITVYLYENGPGGNRTLLSMDRDVDVLASRTVILERKSMFRLDMLPVMKTVGVKSRPNKTIAEVLEPVLIRYNLALSDMKVNTVVNNEKEEVNLSELVSTLDGLKVSVEQKPVENRSKWSGETKQSKRIKNKSEDKKNSLNNNKNPNQIPDKQETEDLINLMSALQSSTMHDQRGLLTKKDLELPDFLKIKSPEPQNNNNNNHTSSVWVCDNRTGTCTLSSETIDEDVLGELPPNGYERHCRMNGSGRSSRNGHKNKGFVELNAQNKTMSSFKPDAGKFRRNSRERISPDADDLNDATIVEDPDFGSQFVGTESDLDVTLRALPTPPPNLNQSAILDRSIANFSPPTPIKREGNREEKDEETIMV